MQPVHLYTIAPDRPFVDVLAQGLMEHANHDPMALANIRVLLPTRRAIKSLKEAFLKLSHGKPMLLPQMQPVGDVDEEELALTSLIAEQQAELLPQMSASRRVLLLAMLVWRFQKLELGHVARMDQSVQLARELAAFLDDVAREELDMEAIHGLVPDELARHWQITVDFLRIIMEQWPEILEQEHKLDPITRRNQLLKLLARHWQESPPDYPVIAAGTTGSTPATARLLEVVAKMEQGMVILPGLDVSMPNPAWEQLEETHPQFGMKQLLEHLKSRREDVQPFGASKASPRLHWLNAALLPADATDSWRKLPQWGRDVIEGCALLTCVTRQEEATAIALALREVLQTPGKTAALVTPDRELARRVAAILQRCHVAIDDSAGLPLSQTPGGIFLQLVMEVVANRIAPVTLLALLKHPLCLAGEPIGHCRHLARVLERESLRGVRLDSGFDSIRSSMINIGELTDEQKEELINFVDRIADIMKPLSALAGQNNVSLKALLQAHIAVAEALSADGKGHCLLWSGEVGEALASFLQEVMVSAEGMDAMEPLAYPGLFGALVQGKAWRPHYGMHPRLHILSPMEARLQQFDRVVLGGLNEGSWPMDPGADPWMSRPMRQSFGLSLPERQIGLSAHDFYTLAHAKEVFFTRAQKQGGAPSVPSRWLMRLEAVLGIAAGEEVVNLWRESGVQWVRWAQNWDMPTAVEPCLPPEPRPPVEARPRSLYVTRIETLLRNPYGLYASHILRLKALDPLDKEPGPAEFGNLVHAAIEAFVKEAASPTTPEEALARLIVCGEEAFSHVMDRPAIAAFWWPRFERIAAWLIAEDTLRKPLVSSVEAEKVGELSFAALAGAFTLKARMDRIEHGKDGSFTVVDYKTGSLPAIQDIARGISCQLLLESAILGVSSIADAQYWHLRGGREAGSILSLAEKAARSKESLEDWVGAALEGVQALIAAFDDPQTPYLHSPAAEDAPRFDDYEHLSRVREWGV